LHGGNYLKLADKAGARVHPEPVGSPYEPVAPVKPLRAARGVP
jgi:hypothetical protein